MNETRLQKFLAGLLCLSIGLGSVSLAGAAQKFEGPKIKVIKKIPSLAEQQRIEEQKRLDQEKKLQESQRIRENKIQNAQPAVQTASPMPQEPQPAAPAEVKIQDDWGDPLSPADEPAAPAETKIRDDWGDPLSPADEPAVSPEEPVNPPAAVEAQPKEAVKPEPKATQTAPKKNQPETVRATQRTRQPRIRHLRPVAKHNPGTMETNPQPSGPEASAQEPTLDTETQLKQMSPKAQSATSSKTQKPAIAPTPRTAKQTVQKTRPVRPAKPKEKPVVKFPEMEPPPAAIAPEPEPIPNNAPAVKVTPAGTVGATSTTSQAPKLRKTITKAPRRTTKYKPPPTPEQVRLQEAMLRHYDRGGRFGAEGKFEDAIAEYKRAIKINPGLADAYVGLAAAYGNLNDWEAAISASEMALKMRKGFMEWRNMIQAHYNLSTAYCVAGDYSRARGHYRKVRKAHHPNTRTLEQYLGRNCKP